MFDNIGLNTIYFWMNESVYLGRKSHFLAFVFLHKYPSFCQCMLLYFCKNILYSIAGSLSLSVFGETGHVFHPPQNTLHTSNEEGGINIPKNPELIKTLPNKYRRNINISTLSLRAD